MTQVQIRYYTLVQSILKVPLMISSKPNCLILLLCSIVLYAYNLVYYICWYIMFWCNHFCSVFVVVVLEEKLPPTVKIRKKSTARLLFRQLRIAYTVKIIGHKPSLLGVQKMATAYTLAMQFMIRKTYLVYVLLVLK